MVIIPKNPNDEGLKVSIFLKQTHLQRQESSFITTMEKHCTFYIRKQAANKTNMDTNESKITHFLYIGHTLLDDIDLPHWTVCCADLLQRRDG